MLSHLPAAAELERSLAAYPEVVARQGVARLPELDRWYRIELPRAIAGRSPRRLVHPELVRLTEWKMARGVWRAPNLALVRSNDPALVEETSEAAFALIPDPASPVAGLVRLKGVGPATASAALAAAAPDTYPFFDEQVAARLPGLGRFAWTTGYYARYAEALRLAAKALGGEWTPAQLERALWAHVGGKAGL